MNPFVNEIVGVVVRAVVVFALGWLVKEQLITHEQAEAWVTGITGFVVVVGWSAYRKYFSRQKLLTALASPAGLSEREVEKRVRSGQAPPVTMPKHEQPYLPKPKR